MNYYKSDNGISWQNRFRRKQSQELISNIKKCTGCETEKGLQEFAFKKVTNYYNSKCKVCERKRASRTRKMRARKNGIMIRADYEESLRTLSRERLASGKKVCAGCKELKSLTEFTRDLSKSATADGYLTRCKKCKNIYQRKRYVKRVPSVSKCPICLKIFQGRSKGCSAECSKEWLRVIRRGSYYKNRVKAILRNKLWERENIKRLGTKYIKRKLGIPNPPKELIELKREQLKVIRAIRTVTR